MWITIPNTNGLYQVNEKGDVKSLPRKVVSKGGYRTTKERILKHCINKHTKYHQVNMHVDGKIIIEYVHKLVAEAFIPNPQNKPQVDHINTLKDDNRVENLRWCTPKENMNNQLTKEKISKTKKGKPQKAKYSKPIQQIDMESGEIIAEYKTGKEASKATNITAAGISAAATNKKCTKNGYTWYTKSAGGYYWRFI